MMPPVGLWQVRFVVGGPAPQAAAQVAGLLCASADLDDLPCALAPMGGCAALEEILEGALATGHVLPAVAGCGLPGGPLPRPRARDDADTSAPACPFYASSRLVTALARPPARELPGIRSYCGPTSTSPRKPSIPNGLAKSSPVRRRFRSEPCWTGPASPPGSWQFPARR